MQDFTFMTVKVHLLIYIQFAGPGLCVPPRLSASWASLLPWIPLKKAYLYTPPSPVLVIFWLSAASELRVLGELRALIHSLSIHAEQWDQARQKGKENFLLVT